MNEIKMVCRHTMSILENLKTSKWLSDRLLVVRYEDLAKNPYDMAENILQHAGLELTEDVKMWIDQNTQEISYKKL